MWLSLTDFPQYCYLTPSESIGAVPCSCCCKCFKMWFSHASSFNLNGFPARGSSTYPCWWSCSTVWLWGCSSPVKTSAASQSGAASNRLVSRSHLHSCVYEKISVETVQKNKYLSITCSCRVTTLWKTKEETPRLKHPFPSGSLRLATAVP